MRGCGWGRGSPNGDNLFSNGLAALRSPCSRLQVLCLPSVASPFAGPRVHRTLGTPPAHPPPYDNRGLFVSPTGDNILAGSRPGRRGTLVSAKVPKAICACAIARKPQRVPCTPSRLRGSGQGTFPVPGPDARDPSRARSGPTSSPSALGSAKGAQKNTKTKQRSSAAPFPRLE